MKATPEDVAKAIGWCDWSEAIPIASMKATPEDVAKDAVADRYVVVVDASMKATPEDVAKKTIEYVDAMPAMADSMKATPEDVAKVMANVPRKGFMTQPQ